MTYIVRVVQNLIFILIGVFVMPVFYHKLGPEGLGTISYIDSIATVFSILAGFGIARYGTRAISQALVSAKNTMAVVTPLRKFSNLNHLVVTSIYLICVFFVIDIEVPITLILISLISVNRNLFNIDWYYEAIQKFNLVSIKNILVKVIMILALFFLIDSPSFDEYFYFFTSGFPFVSFIVLYFIFKLNSLSDDSFKSDKVEYKKYYIDLVPSVLLGNSYLLFFQADKIILGSKSIVEVGNYALSERIVLLILPIIMSLIIISMPKLTKSYHSDSNKYRKDLEMTLEKIYLIVIPISFCLYLYAEPIISFIGGGSFTNAEQILKYFSVCLIVMTLWRYLTSCLYYATSNEWSCFAIIVFFGIMNVIYKVFFAQPTASSYVLITIVAHILVILTLVFYAKLKLSLRFKFGFCFILKYSLISVASICIVRLLWYKNMLGGYDFIMQIVFIALVYFSMLLVLKDKNLHRIFR